MQVRQPRQIASSAGGRPTHWGRTADDVESVFRASHARSPTPATHRLSVVEAGGDRVTWTYDRTYQLLTEARGGAGGYTHTFSYDPVGKETDAETVKFLWDGQNIVQEYDESDVTQADYTQDPQPAPQPFGNLVSQRRELESSFYSFDALGSTRNLTDDAEVETDDYTYEAFGKVAASSGTTENPFQWVGKTGYYADEETSLYSLRRRQYGSGEGRFISEDPVETIKTPYGYVGNNPIRFEDASGREFGRPEDEQRYNEATANVASEYRRLTNEELQERLKWKSEILPLVKDPEVREELQSEIRALNEILFERTQSGEPAEVQQRRWEAQEELGELLGRLRGLQRRRNQTDNAGERWRLDESIHTLVGRINTVGRVLQREQMEVDPVTFMSFEEKLGEVLKRAAESGEFTAETKAKLEQLAQPESLAILAGWIALYGGLHGTPLAPVLVAVDIGMTGRGGIEAGTAIYLIYKQTDEAVSTEDLDLATDVFVEQATGPAADAIFSILLWVVGRSIGRAVARRADDEGIDRSLDTFLRDESGAVGPDARQSMIPEEGDPDFVGPTRRIPEEGDPDFVGPPRPAPEPYGPALPGIRSTADSIIHEAGGPTFGANFLKKIRKHIDQIRKRHAGQVTEIPAPRRDQAGAMRTIQQIIRARVAQGGGTIRPPGSNFPNTIEYVDGNVSYIFSQDGTFITVLKN